MVLGLLLNTNAYAADKNIIFFADVEKDDYYKNLGINVFFQKEEYKNLINNYGFIIKNPKGYYVEYIFDVKKEDKQYGDYFGNFIAKNLETGKSQSLKFKSNKNSLEFYLGDGNNVSYLLRLFYQGDQAVWYKSTGMNCFNEQNPQCNKIMGALEIPGFTDKKNNSTYAELVETHKKKVIAYKKRKAEEKKIKELKREINQFGTPIKRSAEKHKLRTDYITTLEEQLEKLKAEEAERRRIAKEEEEKRRIAEEKKKAEKKRIDNLPENRLYDAYTFYISIKKFHEANSIYYVSSSQMSEARSQIKAIEKILVEKDSTINTEAIWKRAARKIDGNFDANTMAIAKANPSEQFQGMAKIYILGLTDVYNKLIGPKTTEKDF